MGSNNAPFHILYYCRCKGFQNVGTSQSIRASELPFSERVFESQILSDVRAVVRIVLRQRGRRGIYIALTELREATAWQYKFTPPSRIGGIFNNPNDADHIQARNILGVAFSDKAVREREPFLQDYTTLFIKRLKEQPVGKPIDMVWWVGLLARYSSSTSHFRRFVHAL